MNNLRCPSALMLTFLATATLAQPAIEDDDAAASRDPDVIAAEELVRDLRDASQKLDPNAVLNVSATELFEILETCPLYEMVEAELEESEQELEETLSQAELSNWQSQFRLIKAQALNDCCVQQSVDCFQ